MAVRPPGEQGVAQPPVPSRDDLLSSHRATPNVVQPGQGDRSTAADEEVEAAQVPHSAYTLREPTAIIAGVAILAAVVLFVAGGYRRRIESLLLRLLEKAGDSQLPLILPVSIVEIAREMLLDRQAVSMSAADRRSGKQTLRAG